MKRTIKKNIWMNQKEADELRRNAEGACMNEATYLRMLVSGYAPKPAPDEQFYEAMNEIDHLADQVEKLFLRIQDPELKDLLQEEIRNWHDFRNQIEIAFLRPERII